MVMNREWKPGDVAMAAGEYVAYTEDGVWFWAATGLSCANQPPRDLRPPVVIDPEDREAVERLLSLFADALNWGPHNTQRETYREPLQAALREYANPKPPRPDEPRGLGAVVEDEDGVKWVRNHGSVAPWLRTIGDTERPWRYYADIDAVRVLSPGVEVDQ